MSSRAVLLRQLSRIEDELFRLDRRPEEPRLAGGEHEVIRWDMRMGGGSTVYSYAAIAESVGSIAEVLESIDKHLVEVIDHG